ncbi:hypothetical protein DFS34DRAFT_637535 [Phlyctochytrium arcticum]|nr:hypothetical protein DFS34DRAFT_637535 [Phlyctochytrium arcticum]
MRITSASLFLAAAILAPSVFAIEDPRTTAIKADLAAFCSSLGGKPGKQGANCFDISGAFFSAILAGKANSEAGRCERSGLAQQLRNNFDGAQAIANAVASAPLNVIPPAQLPGPNPPCGSAGGNGGAAAPPPQQAPKQKQTAAPQAPAPAPKAAPTGPSCGAAPAAPATPVTPPAAKAAGGGGGLDAIRCANGRAAQTADNAKTGLSANSACTDGTSTCVGNSFGQCVGGKFLLTACPATLACQVLPLVNKEGTSVACSSDTDKNSRIASALASC